MALRSENLSTSRRCFSGLKDLSLDGLAMWRVKREGAPIAINRLGCTTQRWSPRGRPWPRGRPRGQILKSLALASKVKSLALASRPQVLENWPVLGSRTALFFGKLKFCGAVEKIFGKRFFVEIA